MSTKQCIQGRWISTEDIEWLRRWIEDHPGWSRKRIARELCIQWDWRDGRGRLKDWAARSFLLKVHDRGAIGLPPLQENKRRVRRAPRRPARWTEPHPEEARLKDLQPVRVEPVNPGSEQAARWAFLIDCYHYLGLHVIGENMGYLATDVKGQEVACLLFGAAAWRCEARDRYLGWTAKQRGEDLQRVANNTRFLIFPWVRVKNLASHILGQAVDRIQGDWQVKYGHGLDWLETFVETGRFDGICYRAANWKYAGQTRGRSRQDRNHQLKVPTKAVYLYQLRG